MIEYLEDKMKTLAESRIAVAQDLNDDMYYVHQFVGEDCEVIYVNGICMYFENFEDAVEFALKYIALGKEIGECNDNK